jgi:type IV secretion system protein VirB4
LQYLETRGDRAWAKEWLTQICELNRLQVSPGQVNEIARALESMWANGHVTMTDFVSTVQDESIREVMREYTIEGSMGHLFDAPRDNLGLADFTVFEIEELLNMAPKYGLPILLYLFRRIERSLHGQPAAILLDEAWLMLGHEGFRHKIREWLKVMRKANCLVLMATQSLSDAANSGILDVIIESTASKIFLPNPNARQEEAAALYRRFGLNDRQIEIIADAVPKRQYYYVSERGRRLYELALGPLALALVAISDKDSVLEVKKCEERFGERWVEEWLRRRGMRLDQYVLPGSLDRKQHTEKELVAAA